MSETWQPTASREILTQRARLFTRIRAFMAERDILEVDTPVLSRAAPTDPHIHSVSASVRRPDTARADDCFLHTSPEFPMKRLLAAGSGSIYQIAHVFRNDESGRLHQPEFCMLEWYRVGLDHHGLMDELSGLLGLLGIKVGGRQTYDEAFREHVGLAAHGADTACLVRRAAALGFLPEPPDEEALYDFIFNAAVAPRLGLNGAQFIHDFPVRHAALARVRPGNPPVAERFELFIDGLEIANGFHELADAGEQRRRFEADNRRRAAAGLTVMPVDENLLQALHRGLPDCAGVAVGLDRLLMILCDARSLDEVIAFPFGRA